MTTTQLQLRRDTTANVAAITPAQGEPIYDVSREALVLGDGATAGGHCVTPFGGAWTPQLQFGGANTGMTGTFAGTYVAIPSPSGGAICIAFFVITLTAKGSATGVATIAGLPFAASQPANSAIVSNWSNFASTLTPQGNVGSGSSVIGLTKLSSGSVAQMADTDFTNTTTCNGMAIFNIASPTA